MPIADAIVTITISMNKLAQISVEGPLDQTMLCYGLLDMARDQVHQVAMDAKRVIQGVTTADLAALQSAGRKPGS